MKISVFTSNQPRHLALIESLATIADQVFAVIETKTIFPGQVKDFYSNSKIMSDYFRKVIEAEKNIFGDPRFLPKNVQTLSIKQGDLNSLSIDKLDDIIGSDYYIVFGSSYIKGNLVDFLIKNRALNIHMGLSPFYRGANCNFWALYDGRPEYVGATIHLLSKGLDSGDMLFHAVSSAKLIDGFHLGMFSVKAAFNGLLEKLKSGEIFKHKPIKQDPSLEIRYARNDEFNDQVALDFLNNLPEQNRIKNSLLKRDKELLLRPFEY